MPAYPVAVDGETVEIRTANDLAVCLEVLRRRHDRTVLEELRPHLADIIDSSMAFAAVLKPLTPRDQAFLIDALGADLAQIIGDAHNLRDILANLSVEEVEVRLLRALGRSGLTSLIRTPRQLADVFEWVYGSSDEVLLELLPLQLLKRIARNAVDLSLVLQSMTAASQDALIDRIGSDAVVNSVRDGADLAYLLRALPDHRAMRLLNNYSRERLLAIIADREDWNYLCRRLRQAEADHLYEKMGVTYRAP